MKFKWAVGTDNYSGGARNVSQINHPRCEQNFQVGFLHILFLWISLKLKSFSICNIIALESFFFSKYSLIPHNPFIPFYFPAISPLICFSKAYWTEAHLDARFAFSFVSIYLPQMDSYLESLWILLNQHLGQKNPHGSESYSGFSATLRPCSQKKHSPEQTEQMSWLLPCSVQNPHLNNNLMYLFLQKNSFL